MFVPKDGRWLDPLALLCARMPIDSPAVKALPEDEKRVAFAYRDEKGRTVPAGAKVIWPFACKAHR